MTQEEKQLLLIDLSARLPYGVICKVSDTDEPVELLEIKPSRKKPFELYDDYEKKESTYHHIEDVMPYLRPMSSMTEEEWVELGKIANDGEWIVADFYYSHHIDCWGLIPKGLALEALEGMYKS